MSVEKRKLKAAVSPRDRLLPALGARLGARPLLAGAGLRILRLIPGRTLRASVFRNVTVPLVRRMDANLEVTVVEGSRMRVDTSDVTGRMLATSGIWEPHVTAVFRRLLRPGDVCVDVGASVGYFTLLASRLVGPAGHIYAVEPERRNFATLTMHLELNRVSNVTAERVAAGAHEGEELLYQPRPRSNLTAWSMMRLPDERSEEEGSTPAPERVRVTTLARLLPPAAVPLLRLVKIDVDGYEVEVLEGLDGVYRDVGSPHVVVEVHREIRPEAPAAVAEFCRKHGLAAATIVDDRDAERVEAARHPRLIHFDDLGDLERGAEPLLTVLLSPRATPT